MTVRRLVAAGALAVAGLALALVATLARHPAPHAESAGAPPPAAASLLGRLPLAFEANRGQWDGEALFRVAGRGGTAFVTRSGAVFALPGDPPADAARRPGSAPARTGPRREAAAFRMRVVGASADARAEGLEALPGKANFFLGNDPSRWRSGVPTYARAKVTGVRPGVDVVYYGREGQLEYDFALAPGVDPGTVKLAFEGVDSLRVNADGDLLVRVGGREVLQRRPQVYEEGPAGRRALGAAYVMLPGNAVAFHVEGRDPARRLVIDPVIVFGRLLGGGGGDDITAIGVDASGNVLVAGTTSAAGFPLVSEIRSAFVGASEAFVAKVKADGSGLLFSTYLGGSDSDAVSGMAVDGSGCPYVTGTTLSPDFPILNGFKTTRPGGYDGFVTKLRADGSDLVYSTFLGGTSMDTPKAIAVDGSGCAYVAGATYSGDFPTLNPIRATLPGSGAAFVTKVSASGGAIVYSTFLGGTTLGGAAGSPLTEAVAIAVDGAGSAYLAGYTNATDFPTTVGAFQRSRAGATSNVNWDTVVAKLRADGRALVYSTYLGGTGNDLATSIAVNAAGSAHVAGYLTSTDFPTSTSAYQRASAGGREDGFVTRLTPDGAGLVFSTYLGGSWDYDRITALALDGAGRVWVAGWTYSTDYPAVGALQGFRGSVEGFLAELEADGSALALSTYLSGSSSDEIHAIAVDAADSVYVGGITQSSDFPVTPAAATNAGSVDAFVLKLAGPTVRAVSPATGPLGGGATVTISGNLFATGATVTFGGVAAASVTFVDATTIRAVTPAHAAGAVDVVVTNSGGATAKLVRGYTYAPPPAILTASPATGATTGGTVVWLGGSGFLPNAAVTLGGVAATNVNVTSGTSLSLTTPAHAAGAVDVVITNPDGQAGTLRGGLTYAVPPSIASVAPASGPVTGGTRVTVSGAAFQGNATVALGGAAGTNVNVTSTALTFTAPAHAAGAVDLVVTNPDGLAAVRPAAYTYVPPPSVETVAPAVGTTAGGTPVTVTGAAFQSGASVVLGGTPGTIVSVSATSLTFSAPAHAAGTVDLLVVNPDGQFVTRAAAYTYVSSPWIERVAPASVPAAGGRTVTVTGAAFQTGATVSLGGVAATNVNVTSTTSLTFEAPAHPAGAVDVVVTNPDGQVGTLPGGLTYLAAPSVASVAPASGSTAGGTIVTVTGAAFQSGARVAIGGVDATNVNVTSATTLTATAPAHAAGTVDVVVTNPDGQSATAAAAFTYVPPPPVVTAVEPTVGTSAGGTVVTLAGSGFQAGAAVSFGGAASRLVTVQDGTRLAAATPQHTPGPVDVVVTNPDGQSVTVASGFTYFSGNAPAPTLRAAAPAAGPEAGGTRVTLTGTGFQPGIAVSFGGALATAVQVDTGGSLTATTPAHAAGLVDVVVSNADGQSATLAGAFAYYPAAAPAPTITGVSPASGLEGGGWGVTVTGTGFMAGATVAFGGLPGTGVSAASGTALTATVPQHGTGAVDVVVTNPDGQSATLAGGVEYLRKAGSGCGYLGSDGSLVALLGLFAARAVRRRRRQSSEVEARG